jgi:hypothetical protein
MRTEESRAEQRKLDQQHKSAESYRDVVGRSLRDELDEIRSRVPPRTPPTATCRRRAAQRSREGTLCRTDQHDLGYDHRLGRPRRRDTAR